MTAAASSLSGPAVNRIHASSPIALSLQVDGELHELMIEPNVTLLEVLRERLQIASTTVFINGRRIVSPATLAIVHRNDRISTVESATGDDLHAQRSPVLET